VNIFNRPVKCTRCRNQHSESERIPKRNKKFADLVVNDSTCPRCGGKSYYDCTPQVAWCWASGLIEIGESMPSTGTPLEIARGPKYSLEGQLSVFARHGMGDSHGKLLVPGVPEVDNQRAAVRALEQWLDWINKRRPRDGVVFSKGSK
jgi:hypothetical protein